MPKVTKDRKYRTITARQVGWDRLKPLPKNTPAIFTDDFLPSAFEKVEERPPVRKTREGHHARRRRWETAEKVILLDLNGVLVRKVPLDAPKKEGPTYETPNYRFEGRSGAAELIQTLQAFGYYVAIYTSITRRNAIGAMTTIGVENIVDGLATSFLCIPVGEGYRVKKSITRALDYFRLSDRLTPENCLIVDDSPEKLVDIPDSQKLVVPTFDGESSAMDLFQTIFDRVRHK